MVLVYKHTTTDSIAEQTASANQVNKNPWQSESNMLISDKFYYRTISSVREIYVFVCAHRKSSKYLYEH